MTGLETYLAGTLGLTVLLGLAAALTVSRPRVAAGLARSPRVAAIAAAAVAVQLLHFLEELAQGFHQRFPELLGLAAWSTGFFVAFNVAWLGIWALSLLGVRAGVVLALWPLWFLALALAANAVAHPLLALRAQGYFPGLLTAPLAGLAGVALLWQLRLLTARRG
ncbi:MAG TPA: HXXEE domain-containing protein [Thermoanaerobaculia bacterium]|nr:HXXEE domain-containing protein [Thermoanaerobaculia bacterium]